MRNKQRVIPAEVEKRGSGGVDYGGDRVILVRCGTRMLIWVAGHDYWADRLTGTRWTASKVKAIGLAPCHSGTTIFEGKRITPSLIKRHIETIRHLLGAPELLVEDIDPKRGFTTVVEEGSSGS